MLRALSLGMIRIYQLVISPYLPAMCRHLPSCSEYAHEAIVKYGVLKGTWMAAKRLGRCRPMGTRGYDPVP